MQPFDGFHITGLMMPLQPDADFQIFLFGQFAPRPEPADAGAVHRHRFLGEDIFAGVDRFLEMNGAEARRRRQNHHVGQRNRLFVGVETDELPVFRHIHAVRVLSFSNSPGWTPARCGTASAMATSFTGPSVLSAWSAAPEPRPPQPIRAIFKVSLDAAYALRSMASPPRMRTADNGGSGFKKSPAADAGFGDRWI